MMYRGCSEIDGFLKGQTWRTNSTGELRKSKEKSRQKRDAPQGASNFSI